MPPGSSFQRKGAVAVSGEHGWRPGCHLSPCYTLHIPWLYFMGDPHYLSSFRPCADPRTRPGQHGQTVISSGLADVDAIFGGGYPLGSLILLLEDGSTHLHHLLVQYFLAEGIVSGQVAMGGHLASG